jgi:hypothetical protein
MAELPLSEGGDQETATCLSPAVTAMERGAEGVENGATVDVAIEGGENPAMFFAETRNL